MAWHTSLLILGTLALLAHCAMRWRARSFRSPSELGQWAGESNVSRVAMRGGQIREVEFHAPVVWGQPTADAPEQTEEASDPTPYDQALSGLIAYQRPRANGPD